MSAPETSAATMPLPAAARITITDQTIVRIAGPGTDKFLQGQFSQQITDVTPQFSPRAAACSPKGRAYCLTRMVRDGDDILIALPNSLIDETLAQLRKYLMLFRGTSMDVQANATVTGLLGEPAASAVIEGAADRLLAPGDTLPLEGGHLIRTMDTADGLVRFEFWQTSQSSVGIGGWLNGLEEEGLTTWQASEIAAGVPSLSPETSNNFVPQMLNWQHLGGIHFKKGCYTGQEVIARMHFLGQLKKSLFRFAGPREAGFPAPGSTLLAKERPAGTIVNVVKLADGGYQCLAVVRHDAARTELVAEQVSNWPLHPLPLPYEVPEQQDNAIADT